MKNRTSLLALPLLLAPQLASAQAIVVSPTNDALLRTLIQIEQRSLQELDIIRQQMAFLLARPGSSTSGGAASSSPAGDQAPQ